MLREPMITARREVVRTSRCRELSGCHRHSEGFRRPRATFAWGRRRAAGGLCASADYLSYVGSIFVRANAAAGCWRHRGGRLLSPDGKLVHASLTIGDSTLFDETAHRPSFRCTLLDWVSSTREYVLFIVLVFQS
jgi:hypothetical protein